MQIQVIVLVMNRWEELVNTSIIRRRWCCFFCLYNDWMLQVRLQSLEEEKQLNDLSHTGFYKVVQRAPPLLASLQRTEWNNEAEMIRGALKGSYWLLVMFKTHNLCSRTQTSEADWGQVMTHLKLLMLPSHARVLKPLSHENSASIGAALSFARRLFHCMSGCFPHSAESLTACFLTIMSLVLKISLICIKPCEKKKRTSCIILQQEGGREAAKVERLEILRG